MSAYSKYKAKKTVVDGITFDSRKEANRYQELKLLEKAGQIRNLERQVEYELIPSQKIDGKVVERAVKYKVDFEYVEDGGIVCEDVKGYRTKEYIIKRKLMLYKYGIRLREV